MSWDITDVYEPLTENLIARITVPIGYGVDEGQFIKEEDLDRFGLNVGSLGRHYQHGDAILVYQSRIVIGSQETSISKYTGLWENDQGYCVCIVLIHPEDQSGEKKKRKRTDKQVSNIKPELS